MTTLTPEEEERLKLIEANKKHAEAARALSKPDPQQPASASKKKSEDVLELVDQSCKELFHDQYQKPYAVIEVNAHAETIPIASSNFKHWVARLYYAKKDAMLGSEDLSSVLNTLKGRALYDGQRRHIDLRVAGDDSAIYYDLTDEKWHCVKLTRDGWTVEQAPVLFARYNNQLPQLVPAREYPADIFDKFIALTNISSDEHKLLFKVYIVALFLPNISKPVLLTHGVQGSGKTFLQRLAKALVDPSIADTLTIPKSPAELIQQLSHNYVALYDNLSEMTDWISDMLCRAVTGSGASKRMLYSDDDDIIYSFKRCVMLNGISVVANKADLLDRALMIQLERIPKDKQKKESDLLAEFATIKPQLLGFIFDTLAKVLQRKGEVKLTEYPRLADFAEYGELISRCMGYENDAFKNAYFKNIDLQTEEVLEAYPVATVVMAMFSDEGIACGLCTNCLTSKRKECTGRMKFTKWTGTPSELYGILTPVAKDLNINGKAWPGAPNALSTKLKEVSVNLAQIGIKITRNDSAKKRVVDIEKTSS